ncbi:MAG TPA: hypothetical protein VHT75_20375 [Acidimicrobiales bacterium]|nr:hypothetical protein [Acidimicrobiales bacterium]
MAAIEARLDRMAEEVVTRRLRVVDAAGQVRVRLDSTHEAILVSGPNGVERLGMICRDNYAQVRLNTTEPDTYLSIIAGEEGAVAEATVRAVLQGDGTAELGVRSGALAPGYTVEDTGGAPTPAAVVLTTWDDSRQSVEDRLETIESIIIAMGGAAEGVRNGPRPRRNGPAR